MNTKGRYRSRQAAQSSTHCWGATHSMSELPPLLQRRPIIPHTRPSPAQHCCCCSFQDSQSSVSHPFKHLCMAWAQLCKEQQCLDEGQRGRLLKPGNQLHLHAGAGAGGGTARHAAMWELLNELNGVRRMGCCNANTNPAKGEGVHVPSQLLCAAAATAAAAALSPPSHLVLFHQPGLLRRAGCCRRQALQCCCCWCCCDGC